MKQKKPACEQNFLINMLVEEFIIYHLLMGGSDNLYRGRYV